MTNVYTCNKCSEEMTYQDPKTILVDVGGDEQSIIHDMHICPSCRVEVVDFINSPPRPKPKRGNDGKFLPKKRA